ncbi:MAG TPA: type II toxin-antitoxin system VapC family toxin [Aquabacterium sp.]|nr:type II toxin-antitoxin system VapC family toxin [Aquabacterium sp.]
MIGLDTNVLVRYVMQDDARQSPQASRVIESLRVDAPGFVPLVALVELVWVLGSGYKLSRQQLSAVVETLLRSKELVIDRADLVTQALSRFSSGGADFADALIERIAAAAGCTTTMTFDQGAAKAAGMTLVS